MSLLGIFADVHLFETLLLPRSIRSKVSNEKRQIYFEIILEGNQNIDLEKYHQNIY